MLQAIRSRATGFVVKILFGRAHRSAFGVWGIGDIFRNNAGVEQHGRARSARAQDRRMEQAATGKCRSRHRAAARHVSAARRSISQQAEAARLRRSGVLQQHRQPATSSTSRCSRLGLAHRRRDGARGDPVEPRLPAIAERRLRPQRLHQSSSTTSTSPSRSSRRSCRARISSDGAAHQRRSSPACRRAEAAGRRALSACAPSAASPTVATVPADRRWRHPAARPTRRSTSSIAAAYDQHKAAFQAFRSCRSFTAGDAAATTTSPRPASSRRRRSDLVARTTSAQIAEFTTPEERRHVSADAPARRGEGQGSRAQLLAGGKDFAAVAKEVAKMHDPPTSSISAASHRDDLPPKLGDAAFAPQGQRDHARRSKTQLRLAHPACRRASSRARRKTLDAGEGSSSTLEVGARRRPATSIADIANNIDDKPWRAAAAFADVVAELRPQGRRTAADVDIDGQRCRRQGGRSRRSPGDDDPPDRVRHRRGPDEPAQRARAMTAISWCRSRASRPRRRGRLRT